MLVGSSVAVAVVVAPALVNAVSLPHCTCHALSAVTNDSRQCAK